MASKNKMSVTQLTLLTALNMMGSGIIMLPTKLAEIGTFSILSWLVTATGSTALAYAFAKCGMLSKKPGGMGGYAEYSFGKSGNFMANYTYAVSLVIANVAIAITVVGYLSAFFDVTLSPIATCMATIATLWVCTALNFRGPKITGYISNFSAWGAILPVAGLSLFGWFWFSPTLYVESWNPNNVPFFDALSNSISMTLWAFLGLESACANSEAVDNPEQNVPKAVLGATIGVAVIYILSTNICAGIVGNADLVKSTAPFGLVFSTMFNGTVGKIVIGMMVVSCAGSLLSWQFTIAQVFKSLSDAKFFPSAFSKLTKDDAPVVGMVIITLCQTGLSFLTISPSLYKQFTTLVDLAVVTNIMPYILSMAAVPVLVSVEKVKPSTANVIKFCAFVGTVYSLYALYASGFVAMMYGSLVTFLGWAIYGIAANRLQRAGEVY